MLWVYPSCFWFRKFWRNCRCRCKINGYTTETGQHFCYQIGTLELISKDWHFSHRPNMPMSCTSKKVPKWTLQNTRKTPFCSSIHINSKLSSTKFCFFIQNLANCKSGPNPHQVETSHFNLKGILQNPTVEPDTVVLLTYLVDLSSLY